MPGSKKTLLKICYSAVVAALVTVCTMFVKVPVVATNGYIHIGDAMILIGVYLLGWYAVPAAAVGSMFADLFTGYLHYMLPTLVIKGAIAAIFCLISARRDRLFFLILAALAAEVAMLAGYFAVECFTAGVGNAVLALPMNAIQGAFAVVVAPVAVLGLRAVNFKRLVRIQ